MKPTTVKSLLGVSPNELKLSGPFRVFMELGDGVEEVASAKTFAAICKKLPDAFGVEPGSSPLEDLPGETKKVRALAYQLSAKTGVKRVTREAKLRYLNRVRDEHPELRLVVAWEADAPPSQDFGFGIFATIR